MTDSWWLKVKRAQKHMVDIDRAARQYASLNPPPYRFDRLHSPKRKPQRLVHAVRTVQAPDALLSMMMADFVHNLRTALDHIAVACLPEENRPFGSFPLADKDIWAKNANGDFVINDEDGRKNFNRAIKDIAPKARTIIEELQPYKYGTDAFRNSLGILSRLDNADKHRKLITFSGGVKNVVGKARVGGQLVRMPRLPLARNQFLSNDTPLAWDLPRTYKGSAVNPSEVEVQFSATSVIHVQVTRPGGNRHDAPFPVRPFMRGAILDVRRVLRALEPFVIR